MRTALIALALMQSAACSLAGNHRQSIVVASSPAIDASETGDLAYDQYVDPNSQPVVEQQAQSSDQKSQKQSTRTRLFDHWTAAYLFTR